METYRSALYRFGAEGQLSFATASHEDFSAWKGDRRLPHADFADLFDGNRSRYAYGVESLRAILLADFGAEFEELQLVHEEPRTLEGNLDAEQEFFDKVWYVRHLIRLEKESAGEAEPPPLEIRAGAHAAARAIEERYGEDKVGPSDDWGWGFVNGKLSALRWVLGSEWDFLDTESSVVPRAGSPQPRVGALTFDLGRRDRARGRSTATATATRCGRGRMSANPSGLGNPLTCANSCV